MIVLSILGSLAAIGVLCWLLFTLAVFALPFFLGVTVGAWAYGSGAGWLGAVIVGLVAAGATFTTGQLLLALVRPLWLKLVVVLAFVAPAVVAGCAANLIAVLKGRGTARRLTQLARVEGLGPAGDYLVTAAEASNPTGEP